MKLVIIGNGVAGVTTARLVADCDPTTDITIYSEESHPYYLRPRLVEVVAGRVSPAQMSAFPAEWYEKRRIKTVLNCRVLQIHPTLHRISLGEDRIAPYDQLVLAIGARPWVPPIPGAGIQGVHTLRTLGDALFLHDRARVIKHALVLGGGLLGLGAAMALRAHRIGVTVVELEPRLLPLQLDHEGAQLLRRIVEAEGIEVITGEACVRVEGQARVERAVLQSGRAVSTDLVAATVGVRPNIALAQDAGIACHRGVLVDDRMATSAADIYAVGDVAEYDHRVIGIIPVALAQAKVAAAQICGDVTPRYRQIVPSTTIKLDRIELTSLGEVNPRDGEFREIRRADAASGTYKKLVLRDGRFVGAIILGDRASVAPLAQLVARNVDVSSYGDALLADGFDLYHLG